MIENDPSAGSDLFIDGFSFVGAGCGSFGLTAPATPIVLMPGEFTTADVSFTPFTRGVENCTLRITSNDGGLLGSSTDVPMTGNGIAPELGVSMTTLSFSSQRVSAGAAQMSFDIENNGDLGMELTVDDVSGLAAPFSITGGWTGGPVVLAPGETLTITIDFDPGTIGTFNDAITISSDDPVDATETVFVSGEGTEAQISAPLTVDFSDVVVLDTGDRAVTISNGGNADLTVLMTAVSGGAAGDFTILGPAAPFVVGAGGTRDIDVRCQPSAAGLRQTTLEITSDADATPFETVTLDCTGVKPDISVVPATPIDFGSVEVPGSSLPATFDIVNANLATTSDLTFNVEITGPNPSDFDVTPGGCVLPSTCTLVPGASQTMSVVFTPGGVGVRSATLVVNSDDRETPVVSIDLQGTGTQPAMTLVSPGAGSHDFGDVPVMMPSAAVSIIVRNDGSAGLDITQRQLGGANPGEFNLIGGPTAPLTLAPTETATWQVTCEPTDIGLRSATFQIASNSATGPDPLVIPLDCNGVQSELIVTPSPIAFGDVRIGEDHEISVDLTNDGNIDLEVNSLSLSNAAFSFSAGNPPPSTPFTLPASGGTASFGVVFTPTMNQAYNEILTIETDTETRMTTMSGFGRLAQLSMDPVSHNFGDIDVCDGGGVQQSFTIDNTGDGDWELVSVSVDNTDDFSVGSLTPLPPATIAPGGQAQFTVTADPQAIGTAMGTITVQTDIPGAPMTTATVSLNGTSGDISLSDTAVDFGTHDIQAAGPATRMVTITNTGASDLTISSAAITGPDASRYAVTGLSTPATIPPAPGDNTLDVVLEYQPVVESAGDDATLELTSDAGCGAASEIALSGRGVDRHIAVEPALAIDFGAVYRNPATPASRTIDISNTGEAPLALSIQPLPDASPFSLRDAAPMLVMPQDVETVTIDFAPTTSSPAGQPFTDDLVIMNDDDDQPMVSVELTGIGLDADLAASPGMIVLPDVAVGDSVLLTDVVPSGLELVNRNEVRALQVREIQVLDPDGGVIDDGSFTVIGLDQPTDIAPGERLVVDLEFRPETAGDVAVRLAIFVEGESEPTVLVEVTGRAKPGDRTFYACGTTRGGGDLVVLLALAVLIACRRRRVGPGDRC